jgi:hypothetical protein|tara:strand:- start:123 stop:509 length:387 start_codon:yes stop_codon:yes gene_type:complete
MKRLLILLFSIFISFSSYAEWFYIDKNQDSGVSFYIDTDTIEEWEGYVYWWDLNDYPEPSAEGRMSSILNRGGDCINDRFVNIAFYWFKESMANGEPGGTIKPTKEWTYPVSGSVEDTMFKFVCEYVK